MNITMLSMQQDQELHAAEIVANINHSDSQVEFLEYSKNISDGLDSIEEASQTSATLESIKNLLANNKEEIPACAAQALKLSIEHMSARLGYKKTFNSLSMESYSNDPKRNVRIALEGIGDILKSIIQAIINAIKKVVGWFTGFFTSSSNHSSNIQANAKETAVRLETKLKENTYPKKDAVAPKPMDENKMKNMGNIHTQSETKISQASFEIFQTLNSKKYEHLVLNNKPIGPELGGILDSNYQYLKSIYPDDSHDSFSHDFIKFITEVTTAVIKDDEEKIQELLERVEKIYDHFTVNIFKMKKFLRKEDEEYNYNVSDVMLGDFIFSFRTPKNKEDYSIRVDMHKTEDHDYEKSKESAFFILHMDECLTISKIIEKNMSENTLLKINENYLQFLDKIVDMLNSSGSTSLINDRDDRPLYAKLYTAIQRLMNVFVETKVRFGKEIIEYFIHINQEALRYIKHCEKANEILLNNPNALKEYADLVK